MKKIFCFLCIVVLLFVGSLTIFAKPHSLPGTEGFSRLSSQSFFSISDNFDF